MVSIPYSINERSNQGITSSKSGISDITFSGFYQLLNSRNTVSKDKLLVQSLWLGGGIKAPTGKYNPSDKSVINQSTNLFQLGTGSTDFLLQAMYDVRLQDAGINVSSNYKINTTNQHGYRYGNKLGLNSQLYYKVRIKDAVTIAPNTGLQYELAAKDRDKRLPVHVSGGNILLGTLGMEGNFKRIAVGSNYQVPLNQNLGSGFVQANNRWMIHVSLAL